MHLSYTDRTSKIVNRSVAVPWTASEIERAVVGVLTSRFSDCSISEIEISEREARSIAGDVILALRGACVPRNEQAYKPY
jgi:hypothetical protein